MKKWPFMVWQLWSFFCMGHAKQKCVFEPEQNAQIQILLMHVESLLRAFALVDTFYSVQ